MSKMEQRFLCEFSFNNKQKFFDHVKSVHKTVDRFKCIFEKYNRLYSKFHSFSEHIKKKHTISYDNSMDHSNLD